MRPAVSETHATHIPHSGPLLNEELSFFNIQYFLQYTCGWAMNSSDKEGTG